MKHINLLPKRKLKGINFELNILNVGVLYGLIFAASFGYFNRFKGIYGEAIGKRDELLAELKQLEAEHAVNDIQRVQSAGAKNVKPIFLGAILADIAKKTPPQVQLDKIGSSEENGLIVIEATLPNTDAFAELRNNLRHTKWCEKATLVSLSGDPKKGEQHIKLECPGES